MSRKVSVYRKEHFNAAHRLHNTSLSAEENKKIFGKCNNVHFHGHNYELIVKVTGEVNPITGYVIDMKVLSDVIQDHVLEQFDHKNLNLDTEIFKSLNPTAENIAMVIWDILRREIDNKLDVKVILYETERNYVEFPAE
jgi:6-pyruvoyltetrahydropterin/6-carboxytetrahydropterin synthase